MKTRATADMESLTGQTLELEKAIRRIVRANDLQSRAAVKLCGLTSAQLVICRGVSKLGEVTTKALSAYADLSAATVVTILDNLEERGIIERYRSTADRRIVHTRLTSKGEAALADAPRPLGEITLSRLQALDPASRRALIASAVQLADLVDASTEPVAAALGTIAPGDDFSALRSTRRGGRPLAQPDRDGG